MTTQVSRASRNALCRLLVDSFADADLPNAQMSNAREIVSRLDSERFHVTMFHVAPADDRIAMRPNTTLIRLGARRQTIGILKEFVAGAHNLLFYVKPSPAAKWYLRLRDLVDSARITVGTIESRSDLHREPTISPQAVRIWEQTVLRCDCLFSNAHAVQKSLESEYGLPSDVVPTGVDTQFFSPAQCNKRNTRPRVLFVGSLRPFKRPQLLLDAARWFPEADFVLVGDGAMAGELRDRVKREALFNVHLPGSLTPREVRDEYRLADIFLFPSRWEGSPKVIVEAAASGLPVIACNDYEPEGVVNGVTGFTVASDDELFARLGELLRNPALRACFGNAGRKHALRFDWAVITRRWEEIFLRLHAKAGRSTA
jgi:glycosyltransferase involved in cell wall biosynthesis